MVMSDSSSDVSSFDEDTRAGPKVSGLTYKKPRQMENPARDIRVAPSMVRLMYQYQYVLKQRETVLKNSKVIYLSPLKVGQAGNFWAHLL